jgi:hypothetical protein
MLMSEAREIGDRQTDAVVNNDLESALDYYSDDAVVITPEGRFEGKQQIKEFMRGWFEPFSNVRAEVLSKFDSGAKAMDEWIFKMKNTAMLVLPDGESIPATGKDVEVHGADVYEVHDGHITEHHIYYDQNELMSQLGVSAA